MLFVCTCVIDAKMYFVQSDKEKQRSRSKHELVWYDEGAVSCTLPCLFALLWLVPGKEVGYDVCTKLERVVKEVRAWQETSGQLCPIDHVTAQRGVCKPAIHSPGDDGIAAFGLWDVNNEEESITNLKRLNTQRWT